MSYYQKNQSVFIMYKGRCPNCGRRLESFFKNEEQKCCLETITCDYAFDMFETQKGQRIADMVNRGYSYKEAWDVETGKITIEELRERNNIQSDIKYSQTITQLPEIKSTFQKKRETKVSIYENFKSSRRK